MLNKVKLIIYATSALLVISGAFGVKAAYSKYKSVKSEMYTYRNNQRAYEEIINGYSNENRVLKLNNSDLRLSNDKLVHNIDSIGKSRKKAKNKPGDIYTGISTTIHDTVEVKVNAGDSCRIDTLIKHNEFTTNRIILENNQLKDILTVNNIEYLYVYSTREYVNSYKHKISRLFHLDWRKETVDRYEIVNENDLIKVNDVRVIKIRE